VCDVAAFVGKYRTARGTDSAADNWTSLTYYSSSPCWKHDRRESKYVFLHYLLSREYSYRDWTREQMKNEAWPVKGSIENWMASRERYREIASVTADIHHRSYGVRRWHVMYG
jgi:hypothetical protein